jgi:nickel/cobalt transporter (NicO) family protein
VQLELDLTPGMALAPALLTDIDRNRDGSVSGDEQHTYSRLVIDALELAVDGAPVPLQLASATFPATDAISRGEGTVQLRATAMLPPLGNGVHHLTFRNRHHPDRSVYLANALVPESDAVAITAQRRDGDQSALTIDYELRHTPGTSRAAWLLSGIALASLLLAIAVRVVRRRARTDSR